mmetsp:Transcript_4993/g.14790  ORF Transcript_4993/g.14790 Transcript_4993/m.14790 type:complete len:161 (-) Transcript_4993:479-961(-)
MAAIKSSLAHNLKTISWNRGTSFPASSYLATSLKIIGCKDVYHKLYKSPDGKFAITLEYRYNDTRECLNFRCIHSNQSLRTESAYSLLLCSKLFKRHCSSAFNVFLPLPSSWNIDGLRLHENNDFMLDKSCLVNKEDDSLLTKLHNLETRVSVLERELLH